MDNGFEEWLLVNRPEKIVESKKQRRHRNEWGAGAKAAWEHQEKRVRELEESAKHFRSALTEAFEFGRETSLDEFSEAFEEFEYKSINDMTTDFIHIRAVLKEQNHE